MNRPEAVIFDLDGTLYLGESLIPGADAVVAALRDAGIRVAFLTNKPIASPESYAEKLSRLGIEAETSDVVTSVGLTVDFLDREAIGRRVFVIGEDYLKHSLRHAGYVEATCPEGTDVVVVSLDRSLDYTKIQFAYRAALSGARVVATNPDLICPMEDGEIIDAGAWIGALEALLRKPVTDVLGKPSRRCAEVCLARLGVDPANAMMVGDRMETDIRMAQDSGMRSALVLSGVTSMADIERYDYRAEFVWEDVTLLIEQFDLR